MPDTPDATAQPTDGLAQLETARAECAARVADAGVVVQTRKDRVAQLSSDHQRLNALLAVVAGQAEKARIASYVEIIDNVDSDTREIARSLHLATEPESLILNTRAFLLFEMIPEAQEDHLRAVIDLRLPEWELARLDAQIHETKLITALAGALLLESDLEVTGAASRRHADLVALRGEAHGQSEEALKNFLAQQAKLRAARVQAGLASK